MKETFKTWDKLPKFYDDVLQKQDPVALQEAKLSLVKGFLVPKSSSTQAWEKINDLFLDLTNKEKQEFISQAMEITYEDLKEVSVFFNPPPSLITDRATVPLNYQAGLNEIPQKPVAVTA